MVVDFDFIVGKLDVYFSSGQDASENESITTIMVEAGHDGILFHGGNLLL